MSEILAMGGYGLYVWGSFGCGLAVLAWNALSPLLARRALMRQMTESE
ncbi:heme exporter protein CcmD [Solimonas sp. SE-A11]|nr:heme exporter protein CcmD [Solimonas sp. SE-A11]